MNIVLQIIRTATEILIQPEPDWEYALTLDAHDRSHYLEAVDLQPDIVFTAGLGRSIIRLLDEYLPAGWEFIHDDLTEIDHEAGWVIWMLPVHATTHNTVKVGA